MTMQREDLVQLYSDLKKGVDSLTVHNLLLNSRITQLQHDANVELEKHRAIEAKRLEQIQHLEERLTLARWVRRRMYDANRRQWERIQELLNQHMRSDETICDLCAEIRDLQAKIAELKPKAASYDELTAPEDAPNG